MSMAIHRTDIDWDALDRIEANQLIDPVLRVHGPRYVPGEGDDPRAIIIGEAPGAHEAIKGRPFIGPAGQVLRQLMGLAELWAQPDDSLHGTTNCWLTNAIKFRLPRNRKPTPVEIIAARAYLRDEWIAVGKPRVVILVGGVALEAVTGKQQSILRAAGKMHTAISMVDGKKLFIWPMVHPTFAINNPVVQPLIEQDWERLGEWLAKNH